MSALAVKSGHFRSAIAMSDLPPKADMCSATRDVRFVPKADILFGYNLSRSARGEVFQFGKSVLHRQHCICIVQVKRRLESHTRDYCRTDIGQAECRMVSHYMTTASRTKLPVAYFGLLKSAEVFHSFNDSYVVRLPQTVGTNWCTRIGTTRFAMAVTHLDRRACYLDLNRPTETSSRMRVSHAVSQTNGPSRC